MIAAQDATSVLIGDVVLNRDRWYPLDPDNAGDIHAREVFAKAGSVHPLYRYGKYRYWTLTGVLGCRLHDHGDGLYSMGRDFLTDIHTVVASKLFTDAEFDEMQRALRDVANPAITVRLDSQS